IMPQKKNPDLPELVRGKSGRVIGNLIAILVVMKGQALAYNKDNQEDKELLFDTVDSLKESLTAWILIVKGMEFKRNNMREALEFGYVNATRLADYLVDKGVPFRDAYKQTGMLVRKAEEKKIALGDLELEEMHKVSNKIDKDIYSILDYKNIIKSYDHLGGSAPNRVRKAATQAIKAIERKKF
ncbi:MAG: argininosuccinate lyase, partial [Candidatus Portiera sp.]|nr:argininosuccinate lyase [Portiera sp.]